MLEHKRLKDQDRLVAVTNTGGHNSWAFRTVTFHGVAQNVEPGEYTVSVQFKTKAGTVEAWYHDINGNQYRRLTVLEVPKPAAN